MEKLSAETESSSMPDEKVRGRKKHPEGRPPIVKKFGLLIRRLRKEAGLSQEEFAYRAKYHRTYQTFIESGAKTPSIETARKQAEVLNLRLSQLFALLEDDEGSIHN